MKPVYLNCPTYATGSQSFTVEESAQADRLRSDVDCFRDAGFDRHHVCSPQETSLDLAVASCESLRIQDRVDAVVYSTCLPQNASMPNGTFARDRDVKSLMDFPVSRLQTRLGWENASLLGLTQQACTGFLGSMRMANWMLQSEPGVERVVCVTADRFPEGALYEQSYNLISDGAASCALSSTPGPLRYLGGYDLANGALAQADDDETVGAFFPWAHRTIEEGLVRLGLSIDDIDVVIPQNTNRNAWRILAQVLRMDLERVCMPSLPDVGHMISGDNAVNLAACLPRLRAGQTVMLFMAGYGLQWQMAVLEVE